MEVGLLPVLGGVFQLLQFLLPGFAGFFALAVELAGGLALFEPFIDQVGDEDGCNDPDDDQGPQRITGEGRVCSPDVWTYR